MKELTTDQMVEYVRELYRECHTLEVLLQKLEELIEAFPEHQETIEDEERRLLEQLEEIPNSWNADDVFQVVQGFHKYCEDPEEVMRRVDELFDRVLASHPYLAPWVKEADRRLWQEGYRMEQAARKRGTQEAIAEASEFNRRFDDPEPPELAGLFDDPEASEFAGLRETLLESFNNP